MPELVCPSCGHHIARDIGVPQELHDLAQLHRQGLDARSEKWGVPNRLSVRANVQNVDARIIGSLQIYAKAHPDIMRSRESGFRFRCPSRKCGRELVQRADRLAARIREKAIAIAHQDAGHSFLVELV
jgi:predicted RNA-binding Zn-ribbon protein involved in translation (DUF1610 family)